MLHGAEHALRVRHHDGDAAVGGRQRGDAARRAVRVVGVALGGAAAVIDEAQRRPAPACSSGRAVAVGGELRAPFAVRDRDRQARARHAAQQQRRRLRHLAPCARRASNCSDAVAHEARPVLGARDELLAAPHIIWQPLQTPSANVSGRAKNAANCSRARGLNRIDFAQPSPAPSTSPYEKPPQATSPRKPSRSTRARERVAHVHVDGVEAGAIERRRHLDLAVDALLAQDRDARARAAARRRRGDVLVEVERSAAADSPGSSRVDARCRAPRRRRPGCRAAPACACVVSDQSAAQDAARARRARCGSPRREHDRDRRRRARRCARTAAAAGRARANAARTRATSAARTCTTAPSSSVNSAGQRIVAERTPTSMSRPTPPANAISSQRHEQAAVGAVVVGEQRARRDQRLHRREERREARRIVEVRRRLRRAAP